MEKQFPRTTVAGVSLSRMIIGSNWIGGWSHTGPAADKLITATHASPERAERMLETFMAYGIDTVMAPFAGVPVLYRAIKNVEQRLGKQIILVDTPGMNVDNTPEARREAEAKIKESRALGATFCLIHHASAEQLVNKNKHAIERLDDYTKMIRDNGMIPGLSAHMPELVTYSDDNGYDIETYIQIYNCMNFLMQVEVESINRIIWNAKKPVMTIKPMAAGRTTPFVGLNFSWSTIRDCDMVTVGCLNEHEAAEDIEISFAALERRQANLGPRSSPIKNQDAFGQK